MQEILKILKNYKLLGKEFYILILGLLLTEFGLTLFPQIASRMMKVIENKQNVDDLFFYGVCFVVLTLLTSIGWFWAGKKQAKIWASIYAKKYQVYREKLFQKSFAQLLEEGTGKLISKFERAVVAEADIFMAIIELLTNTLFKLIIVTVVLWVFFHPLLLLLFLVLVFLFTINHFVRKKIQKIVKEENKQLELNTKLMVKMINDFLTIKIFNKQNLELEKSKKILSKIPYFRGNIRKYQILFYVLLFFSIKLLEGIIYMGVGYYIIKGDLTISLLVMLTGYVWILWNPIDKAINELNRITRQMEVYKSLQKFIQTANTIKNGTKEYVYKTGKIEFKNLDFAYNKDKKIFENLNLEFLSKKKNALIGHSGGGKSTIVKLLLRLYDYEKGEILVDNQELKELKIESFYKHIGYLPQEPGIFDGTIRENLEYAFDKENIENKEEKIWDALEKAQIADMVKNLEKGLDTEVGERGIKLSGGEKQRLAIARIFLKNPEIIILDEPTSALDSISEHKITKALDELTRGKTSIIIAHRLQTVMHSDKIIVLENGKIEAEGKHTELMKNSKIYKTLVDLQNGEILE